MDALKRAEKARQAQAEKPGDSGEESGTEQELSLDPLDPSQILRPEVESAQGEPSTDQDPEGDESQSPAPDGSRGAEDSALSQSMDFGDLSLDDTSATLPSMKSAQRSVDDYFDGTHSMSMSMEPVRMALEEEPADGAPSADHLAGTRSDATTKETARAVFDAKAAAPPRSRRVFSQVVLPLLVLALISAAGFMYWDQMLSQVMKIVDGEPSLVTKRPPLPVPSPPVAAPAPSVSEPVQAARPGQQAPQPAPAPVAVAPGSEIAVQPAGQPPLSATLVTLDTPPGASAVPTETPPEAPAPRADATQTATAAEESQAGGDALQAMADQALLEAMPAAPVDLSAELRKLEPDSTAVRAPVSFRITRNRRPKHVNKDLLQAYEAFQQGANERAMTAYRRVLKRRPQDRDALLGVAALEMRAGNLDQATTIYYRLLNADPRDALVKSALISLREDVDPIMGESTIKNLLQEQPGSANLYFNLGNLFATQSRWSEAQKAYFDAYRLDVGNPDYAYNLAISLDHMGKSRAALQFYQLAVELADAKPASFAQSNALRRIGMLSVVQ